MVNGESDRSLAMERNGTTLHEPLNVSTAKSQLTEKRKHFLNNRFLMKPVIILFENLNKVSGIIFYAR